MYDIRTSQKINFSNSVNDIKVQKFHCLDSFVLQFAKSHRKKERRLTVCTRGGDQEVSTTSLRRDERPEWRTETVRMVALRPSRTGLSDGGLTPVSRFIPVETSRI